MRIATWIILGLVSFSFAETAQAQLLQRLKQGVGKILENQGQQPQPGAGQGFTPQTDQAFAPGYLGLTADEPREGDRGVRVLAVKEGSPAEVVGLRDGDIIIAIDGLPMRSLADMDRILSKVTAGQTLRIVAERAGEQRTLMPKLTARNNQVVARKEPAPDIQFEDGPRVDRPTGRATLGLSVAPLTEDARRQYGLTPTRGAVITNVVAGSPAAQAKIPVGAAIVAVDGRRVDSADELIDMMRLVRADQDVELTFYVGDKLGRQVVRAAAVAEGGAPRSNPPLFGDGGDRPILKKLEKVLEGQGLPGGLIPPGGLVPQGQPQPQARPEIVTENETLRREIDALRKHVERLEGRLSELELKVRP